MNKIKEIWMMAACALLLSALFLFFAVLALFSETARWMIDQAMHRVGEILSEGEERSILKHRQKIDA
jgi:hypothetical protein